MNNFNKVFNSEIVLKDGVYYLDENDVVSYPEDSHDLLFEIEDNSFWFSHRNNMIFNTLSTYKNDIKFLIDIGGGNGVVSKFLQDKGIEILLIEPGHSGVANAKKRGVINVCNGIVNDSNTNDNSISSVGLFDVLEHIEDDISFLKLFNKKLEQKGLIFLTVPAHMLLWSKEDREAGHFRRYTKSQISEKLQKVGFDILYNRYCFISLFFPILLLRKIKDLQNSKSSIKSAHLSNGNKFFRKIVDIIMFFDNKLSSIIAMPFGASIMVVARKK